VSSGSELGHRQLFLALGQLALAGEERQLVAAQAGHRLQLDVQLELEDLLFLVVDALIDQIDALLLS
jgi:hypothetical protein